MHTLKEIKTAIERLTPRHRVQLEGWFYTHAFPLGQLREDEEADLDVQEAAPKYSPSSAAGLISVEEYLRIEMESPERHEYVAGRMFAMSGVSQNHNRISLNLALAMTRHLKGGPCDVFMSDFKLKFQVENDDFVYYPDVMVACDRNRRASHHTDEPKLVIEVLSPSTRDKDEREKFLSYRRLDSVEEYAIFEQDGPELVLYRRGLSWQRLEICGLDASVEFRSIGLKISMTEVFEGVTMS